MRKFTLFLALMVTMVTTAFAQTPVLELSAEQIGSYPYQLEDEDAAKVFALTDLTVAVKINTASVSGRRGLFVTSDPTLAKNTAAEGTSSRYVAYGLNAENISYLASWRAGDRFSGSAKFAANSEVVCVYVINPTNGKFELYFNGALDRSWSGTNPNGFMNGYEIATPAMVKAAHANANIYIGGGVSSEGNDEVFDGTIIGVKVYEGALSVAEIAAISFEDPALLAAAQAEFNSAYTAAQAILDEAELAVNSTELPLQVDNANAAYYLWSNAPEPNEGHIKFLLDGSTGTYDGKDFFHTQWSNPVPAAPHYIEVDLGVDNELSEFAFSYSTRNFGGADDYPNVIQITGSNDKQNYNEIYTVSDLPASSNTSWSSGNIVATTAYRYIRFNVTKTQQSNRTYWHMSEFDIYTNEISVADKYKAVANEVAALKNTCDSYADNATYGIAKLTAAAEAINALVETVNAGVAVEPVTFDIYALDDYMNPSLLEGTVSKLGFVVFAASDNNAALAEAADAPKVCIFDPAMGGAVAEASSIMFGDLLGNGMQLVAVQFDGFATPGTYMVYAPAGAFTVNGQPSEEIISAQFTIPAPAVKVFEVESVTPANGAEVEAINKIEIKFTEDIFLSMDNRGSFYPVNLVDENNNVIELTTSDDVNIYSKAVFTPAEPITAAGTYTLDLSQIKLDGGVCEGSYSWTVVAPVVEPGIDTSKEYYLYSSYNWGMNSGYLTIGTKSGSNYGQVYMDSNKKQSFKLTPSGDGYVVSRLADMGGMSYPEYLDCSHAYNVGNNAMSGSVLYFELNTNGKYYIRSANGYFKADKIDYTTTDWAYHVFSNGDMTSAMEWELVPAIDEEPTTPAVAPVIQTISPAAGAVVEGGVSEIVITFDKEIKSVSSGAQIKVKLGAATTRAYGSNATIDGCTVTFKFGDGGQFGFTTIEDAGEYSVEIPASLCTSEDGGASEAFSYKFTIAAPVVEPGIDTSKEYYLYSSYNWGMNSGYLTIGTKSGSNYGQVYMANEKQQSFKLTPSGDGYVVSRLADMGGMSYPEYLDCSHAYNVGNNAMSGSVLYFELNTNGKYYIRSANGYFKADKIDYTTTDWAYHVFSNGDMTSAMEWELVPAIDEEPTTPAVAPVIQTISPAAGAVVEGGVSEIVITFDKEIKSVSSGAQIKVKLGAATTRAYGSNATIDGCTVTFKFGDGGQFGFTTIEDAGEYSVEIPASLCTSEDGGASEAFSYKFTIAAPAELPALESTKYDRNPLETSYDFTTGLLGKYLLSGVKIYFGEVVKKYTTDLSGDYGQILDADGNVVATLDKCMGANGTMNDFATPYTTTPITAAGTYKVVVKSGVILSADGTKEYKGGEFTFTVEKAAVEVIPSAEDGFFWNASYSHVDEFNKQVITVKNADNDVVINNEVKATLTCGENVYEATVTVEKYDNVQEITLAFDGEFVEGKYALDVPAGLFTVDGVANEAYAQSTFTYRKPQLEITRDFDTWESYLDQVWYMPKGAIITIANAQSVEVDDTKVATIAVGESVYNSTLSYYYDEQSNAYYIELMFEDFYAEGFEFVKGDYTFTLPAGLYTVNGVANEEAVKTYTYGDPIVEEFSVTEILPASGSELESLDAISITFSNGMKPDMLPITCGEKTYNFIYMSGVYVPVDMNYEPIVITEPGTYTLDLSNLEGLTGDKVFSWIIVEGTTDGIEEVETEAEKVIYDLTGRRILEITKSGIYVVNGKKVIVK